MGIPASRLNADGSLKPFTTAEVAAFGVKAPGIDTFDVRQGNHPTKKYSPDGNSVENASYFIDPAKEVDFKIWLLGAAVIYTADSGTDYISRLMPQTFPGTEHTAAMDLTTRGQVVTGENRDASVPVPTYQKMIAAATYRTVPFELRTDAGMGTEAWRETQRYVEVLPSEATAEYLTLPGASGFKFLVNGGGAPDGKLIPYNVGLPIIQGRVRRRWWRVPKQAIEPNGPLWQRVYGSVLGDQAYLGTVNKYDLFGYPAGTLLFDGWNPIREFDPAADDYCYSIEVSWKHVPTGVNYLYASAAIAGAGNEGWYLAGTGAAWQSTENLTDRTALYSARDHRLLFSVN